MMPVQYQQLLSDLAVLAGAACAALSVVLAIVALAQTRAPRGGARALVAGILLLAVGAWSSTRPVTPALIGDAWMRVTSTKPAPGPAPVPEPAAESATGPAAEPATEAPTAAPEAPATGEPAPAASN